MAALKFNWAQLSAQLNLSAIIKRLKNYTVIVQKIDKKEKRQRVTKEKKKIKKKKQKLKQPKHEGITYF